MFSKYDVYTTVQSMYCYPDSDVLKNKLNIRDKAELKQAEEEFTAVKQLVLLQEPMKGRFTKTHLLRQKYETEKQNKPEDTHMDNHSWALSNRPSEASKKIYIKRKIKNSSGYVRRLLMCRV